MEPGTVFDHELSTYARPHTHLGAEYAPVVVSQPEPGDWDSQGINNTQTAEVLQMVDGMGGYEEIRDQVEALDLDDDDNDLPFVMGRGRPSPLISYDRRQGLVVKGRAVRKARKREEQARAEARAGASGIDAPLETIVEEGPVENDDPLGSSGVERGPSQSTAAMPSPRQIGTMAPTVTDRWGNVIPAAGYVVDYPDWVMKALE